MTVEDKVLDTCLEILSDPKAWHQGDYYNDDHTAFCAIGIIREAYVRNGERISYQAAVLTPVGERVRKAIESQYPEDSPNIAPWNDDENRTYEEVVAVFEKARAL